MLGCSGEELRDDKTTNGLEGGAFLQSSEIAYSVYELTTVGTFRFDAPREENKKKTNVI